MSKHNGLARYAPRGWNSWDCYGPSVGESELKAIADVTARELLPHGWDHLVIDGGWYGPAEATLVATTSDAYPLSFDDHGRLLPTLDRFPSAAGGAGFAPVAEHLHARGLKLGIHIMRGIPRRAVHANTPVLGTSWRARDVARTDSVCSWNELMYGVDVSHPGGQAYYDSLFALYASWGVDYVKADDLCWPYYEGEITAIARAIERCGRPIVLSLSPGPPKPEPERADHLLAHADLWRISPDLWDAWLPDTKHNFAGVSEQLARCEAWASYAGPGHWPDADMLCVGRIGPRPPHGPDRTTNLTRDEQVTLMTLMCMARSPLMFGGDPLSLDDWTRALLTNDDVLALQHRASTQRTIDSGVAGVVAWAAALDGGEAVAVFNLNDAPAAIDLPLATVGVAGGAVVRDLWTGRTLEGNERLSLTLRPHACACVRVTPRA